VVLLTGAAAAFWIISHFKLVIETKKDWTAASLTALGFIALGFFTISTPKINSLVIRIGENLFQVGKLEKAINEKKEMVAELENSITDLWQQQVTAVTPQLENATNVGKQVVATQGSVGITVEKAKTIAPNESWERFSDGSPKAKWILLSQPKHETKPATNDLEKTIPVSAQPFLYDTKTGQVSPVKLKRETYDTLMNQIPNLKNGTEK